MKIAIMQPYFLPYIGAFQLINAVNKYIVYGSFKFRNDGWFHRNRMLVQNKGSHFFNVSLINASYLKSFNEIYVDKSLKWRTKICKTYRQNYCNAPYFEEVYNLMNNILFDDSDTLVEFNVNSLRVVSEYLGMRNNIVHDPVLEAETEYQMKHMAKANTTEEIEFDMRTQRILYLCKIMQTTEYINPIGGVNLYDKDTFAKHLIQLRFLHTNEITYQQNYKEFVPNLSIIDVMSYCGREKTRNFLQEFTLV